MPKDNVIKGYERLLIFELKSQSTYTLPSLLLKVSVDWLGLFMAESEPLCVFPIYRPRAVFKHQSFLLAQRLNEQLYAEFDKKCVESWTDL